MAEKILKILVQPSVDDGINLFVHGVDGKPTTVRIQVWALRLNATTHRYDRENVSNRVQAVWPGNGGDVVDGRLVGDSFMVTAVACASGSAFFKLVTPEKTFDTAVRVQVWDTMKDWVFGQDTLLTVEDAFLAHAQPTVYAVLPGGSLKDISGHGYVKFSSKNTSVAIVDDASGRVRGVAAGTTTLEGAITGGEKGSIKVRVEDMLAPRPVRPVHVRGGIESNYNILFLSSGFTISEAGEFDKIVAHLAEALNKPRHTPLNELGNRLNIWKRFEPSDTSGAARSTSKARLEEGNGWVWHPPTLFELGEGDQQNPDELVRLRHPQATQFSGPLGRYLRTLRPAYDLSQPLGEVEWSYEASGPYAGRIGKSAGLVCVILNSRRLFGGAHFGGAWFCLKTAQAVAVDDVRRGEESRDGVPPLYFEPPAPKGWGPMTSSNLDVMADIFVHELCHGFRLGDEYGTTPEQPVFDVYQRDQSVEFDNLGRDLPSAPGTLKTRADFERDVPWSGLERVRRADAVLAVTPAANRVVVQLRKGRAKRWKQGSRIRVREAYVDSTLGTQTRRSKRDGEYWVGGGLVSLSTADAEVVGVDLAGDKLTLTLQNEPPGFPRDRVGLVYEPSVPLPDGRGSPLSRDFFELGGSTGAAPAVPIKAGSKGNPSVVPGAVVLRRGGGGNASKSALISPSMACKMNNHEIAGNLCHVCKYLLVNRIDPSLLGEINDCGCSSFMKYPGYLEK